jgi:hypothetical protein
MILPLLTTTAVVLLPEQVVPTETTTHAPSKLPPPPPPLRRGGGSSRLVCIGLASPRGRCGFGRPRTGERFLVVADAAAATSGLRERDVRGRSKGQQGQSDSASNDFWHKGLMSNHFVRPEPSAQTAPIIRQDLPALPHSSSAASFALSTVSR